MDVPRRSAKGNMAGQEAVGLRYMAKQKDPLANKGEFEGQRSCPPSRDGMHGLILASRQMYVGSCFRFLLEWKLYFLRKLPLYACYVRC